MTNLLKKVMITFALLIFCGLSCQINASWRNSNPTFKVVFIGDEGVGKTSLLNEMLKKQFESDVQSTNKVCFQLEELECFNVDFIDTPGHVLYRGNIWLFIRYAPIAVIVFDASSKKEQCSRWLEFVRNYCKNPKIQIFIVANKMDQCNNIKNMIELKERFEKCGFHFLETSAKDGHNVEELKSQIIDVCKEIYQKRKANKEIQPQISEELFQDDALNEVPLEDIQLEDVQLSSIRHFSCY